MFLYVAVVRDTDGSAFITKAEFDSLKNNFQAQIDNYNNSLDSKIDGAIASYLAGIKLNSQVNLENFYDKYKVTGTDSIGWTSSTTYVVGGTNKAVVDKAIRFTCFNPKKCIESYTITTLRPEKVNEFTWFGIYEQLNGPTKRIICSSDQSHITSVQNITMSLSGAQDSYEAVNSSNHCIGGSGTGSGVWSGITDLIKKRNNSQITNKIIPASGTTSRGYYPMAIYNESNVDAGGYFVIAPMSATRDYCDLLTEDISFLDTNLSMVLEDSDFSSYGAWFGGDSQISDSANMYFYGAHIARAFPRGVNYNKYIVDDFKKICQKNGTIADGLAMAPIDRNYDKVTLSVTPSNDGFIVVYLASDASPNWGGLKSSYTTNPNFVVTAGVKKTFNFDSPSAGNFIFLVYLPSSSSVVGTLSAIEIVGEISA